LRLKHNLADGAAARQPQRSDQALVRIDLLDEADLEAFNQVTAEELDVFPGIDPAMAQRIIEGRPYGSVDDITRVKGIGEATFEKLKDLITVQ